MIKCVAIDDDPLFLKMIEVMFKDMKSARLIGTFPNPVEGMMSVVKNKPDVLLLDLEMPYLDGIEALETLDRPPKVIVISGHLSYADGKDQHVTIAKYLSKSDVQSSEVLERAIQEVVS